MPHSFSRYIYLKTIVLLLRFIGRFRYTAVCPRPDYKYTYRSRDDTRELAVHIYKPKRTLRPSPVLLNWHSSGYIARLHGQDDRFCRHIADNTTYTVLDSTYAIAPEHTFPAPLEDVEDLILSVLDQPDLYDVNNISLSGFSTGGTLALVAASSPQSMIPRNVIQSIIAFYPPTNLALDPRQKIPPEQPAESNPSWALRFFVDAYVPRGVSASNPRISPFFANPDDFPSNVFIATRARDALALEGEALGQMLKDHGKNVTMERVSGFGNSWDKEVVEGSEGARKRDEMYELVVKFLNDVKG